MKDKYPQLALLGIAAIAVLWYLLKRGQQPTVTSDVGSPVISGPSSPSYPNAQPIHMGDISIGGSPTQLTYNTFTPGSLVQEKIQVQPPASATAASSGCGGCSGSDPCNPLPGQPVTIQKVNGLVFGHALENWQGYADKKNISASTPHIEALIFGAGIPIAGAMAPTEGYAI